MPDGGVLAGLGGTSIGIQRWSEDGSLDPTFDAGGINGPVNSIVRDQTGNIYIGGGFTEVGGLSRQRLARLWSNGWVDIAFSDTPITFGTVPAPATVHSMLLEGNGKLVAAGEFSQVDGQGRRNIARVSHRIGIPAERLTVESNGSVIWKREHGGPELRSAPQLMMSATCCSSGDFELLPGSMEWDPVNSTWVYDAFPNSFGTYYLKTRARIGGTGGGVMESPIHQFYGGPVPVSEAELAIEMVADRQVANVGDPVTFELTVTNTGPDPATQVVTEVSLPSGFAYESHQLSQGSYDPVTGIWGHRRYESQGICNRGFDEDRCGGQCHWPISVPDQGPERGLRSVHRQQHRLSLGDRAAPGRHNFRRPIRATLRSASAQFACLLSSHEKPLAAHKSPMRQSFC